MNTKENNTKTNAIVNHLRGINFLKHATLEQIETLSTHTELVKLSKFEIVYHKGDRSTSIYYVLSGIVKVSVNSSIAKEVIRGIAHPEMIFGENSVSGEKERSAMAQALDKKCQILKIDTAALKQLFEANGKVATDFMTLLGNKLRASKSRLESVIMEDARTRVINFLKENALNFGNKVGLNELLLKHSFTQQDIADFTGTSRQTVTTVLNDLKRSNVISLDRRRILIRDFAQLS